MNDKIVTLNAAKKAKNDEFYTTREHSLDFISDIKDDLNYKTVLLPCDTEESEIYIAIKERWPNAIITLSDLSKASFLDIEFNDYEYVITNPPFSLWNKLVKKLSEDHKEGKTYKWLFMNMYLKIANKNHQPLWHFSDWSITKSRKYKNSNKRVNTRHHSNFIKFPKRKLILNTSDDKGILIDDNGKKFINHIQYIEPVDDLWVTLGIFDTDFSDVFKLDDSHECIYNGVRTFRRVKLKLK